MRMRRSIMRKEKEERGRKLMKRDNGVRRKREEGGRVRKEELS